MGRRVKGAPPGYRVHGGTHLGTWSSSTAYVVDDCVSSSGVIYQCILGHTNQGPPNATYWTAQTSGGGGSGDVTGPSSSVDSEVALFSGTTGKIIKRAAVTGIAKLTSGVLSAVTTWAGAALTGTASHVATFDGSGNPSSKAVGTGAGTIAAGDDSRFIAAATATDKVLARTSSGGGAWEETAYSDAAQQAAALAAIASTQGGRVGWAWEHDYTGAMAWMSRLSCSTIRWAVYPTSTSLEVVGCSASGYGTPGYPGGDARGRGQTRTTGTATGNEAGWRLGNGAEVSPLWGFFIRQRIKVGSTTNCRYWLGGVQTLADAPNADTLAGANGAACFRFSSVVPDTNWQLCTWNGTAQTATDTGIAVVADHEYVLDIWTPDGGVTYHYGIADITAATYATGSTTLTVPSTTAQWMIVGKIKLVAGTAAARVFTFYGHDGIVGRWT